jgi:hypothetical protein
VRGFDVRTGRLVWTFHSVPEPGEVGHETWENDAGKTTGAANTERRRRAEEHFNSYDIREGRSSLGDIKVPLLESVGKHLFALYVRPSGLSSSGMRFSARRIAR